MSHQLVGVEANHDNGMPSYDQFEMKKQGFIKNKVMARPMATSIEKLSWISHTDLLPPTFEGNDGDNLWQVQSQQHHGVTYKIHAHLSPSMQIALTNGHL